MQESDGVFYLFEHDARRAAHGCTPGRTPAPGIGSATSQGNMVFTYVVLWGVWHTFPAVFSPLFCDVWLTELLIEVCALYTFLGWQALRAYRR